MADCCPSLCRAVHLQTTVPTDTEVIGTRTRFAAWSAVVRVSRGINRLLREVKLSEKRMTRLRLSRSVTVWRRRDRAGNLHTPSTVIRLCKWDE